MLDNIIRMIFPPRCIFCRAMLDIQSAVEICSRCYGEIPFVGKSELARFNRGLRNAYYDEVVYVCAYAGRIRESLKRYKFFDKASYYRTFGRLLSDSIKKMTNYSNFDIIISVPLYKHKENSRGYNQSRLISRVISRELGVAERSGLICRTRDTKSQSLLDRKERYINIRDAFEVKNAGAIAGKSILLVDDVLTTGSTVNECSRVLKLAGAKRVTVAVIASGRQLQGLEV